MEWHVIYDIHANNKTNTHEHIDKNITDIMILHMVDSLIHG